MTRYTVTVSELEDEVIMTDLGLIITGNEARHFSQETERHLHHYGIGSKWFGATAVVGVDQSPGVRVAALSYLITAGNNDWGAEHKIFDGSETPVEVDCIKYDPQEILIINTSRRNTLWYLRFWHNEAGGGFGTASQFGEVPVIPPNVNQQLSSTLVYCHRVDVTEEIWCKAYCPAQANPTIEFLIGIHEYPE